MNKQRTKEDIIHDLKNLTNTDSLEKNRSTLLLLQIEIKLMGLDIDGEVLKVLEELKY